MHSEVGNLLLEAGLLDEDALQQVLGAVIQYGGSFVQNLVRLELVDDDRVARFLAERLGLPRAEATQFENLPAFLTRMVTAEQVLAHRLVPIMLHQGTLFLAMSDPTDRVGLEEIAFSTGYQTRPVVARDSDIQRAMVRYYDIPPEVSPFATAPAGQQQPPAAGSDRVQDKGPEAAQWEGASAPAGAGSHGVPLGERVPAAAVEPASSSGGSGAGHEPPPAKKRVSATELDELFPPAQQENDTPAFFELTKVKSNDGGGARNIAEAVLEHARVVAPDTITVLVSPKKRGRSAAASAGTEPPPVPEKRPEPPELSSAPPVPEAGSSTVPERPAAPVEPATSSGAAAHQETAPAAGTRPSPLPPQQGPATSPRGEALPGSAASLAPAAGSVPASDEDVPLLRDPDLVKRSLEQAGERDEVARLLVGLARSYIPRVALFVVRRELLVGWMGGGGGITTNQIKGIMIPLSAPSVFKTVCEAQTDYFGSLPRTTINDVFISALGRVRPARVLLIPISVHHRPVAVLYGDCGEQQGFAADLSPLHLIIYDVAKALERIILEKKRSGRKVLR